MAIGVLRKQFGPQGYEVSVPIRRGQLVEFDGDTELIKPAAAGSKGVLGVAMDNAIPAGTAAPNNTAAGPSRIAVLYGPSVTELLASADIEPGALLAAGANGTIVTASSWDTVIGRCVQGGGITSGSPGRVRMSI